MIKAKGVIDVVGTLKSGGVDVWLDGGWGVDALLGRQTRPHKDVDVVVSAGDVAKMRSILTGQSFIPIAGGCAANFVLEDKKGRRVDVHAARFDKKGNGIYRMCNGRDWIYPAEGFSGLGSVSGTGVKCLSARTQMLCHTGYELKEKDFCEMELLHQRFGVAYPKTGVSSRKKKPVKPGAVSLLVFDLDGTLLNSERANFEAVKMALADLKWKVRVTRAGVEKIMGESRDNFYRKLLLASLFSKREELRQKVHQYYPRAIAKYGRSFPGVLNTLKALKIRGYKLALYSYAWDGYVDAAVSVLGIGQYLDYVESVQKNGLTKIELVKKIQKHFPGLKTAVIGDSIHDINAARARGAVSIGVRYGYGKKEMEAADIKIDSFTELLDIFDRRLLKSPKY